MCGQFQFISIEIQPILQFWVLHNPAVRTDKLLNTLAVLAEMLETNSGSAPTRWMQFQREQIKMLIFQRKKKNLSTLIYVNKLSRQWKLGRKRNHQLQQQSNKSNAWMPQLKRGFLNLPRVQSVSRAVHHHSASCGSVWSFSCWRALESDPRCPCAVSRQTSRHGSCVQLLLWNMRDLDQTHKDECPHVALLTECSLSSPQIPFGPNSWQYAKIHLSHWRTTENQEERLKKSVSAWDRTQDVSLYLFSLATDGLFGNCVFKHCHRQSQHKQLMDLLPDILCKPLTTC